MKPKRLPRLANCDPPFARIPTTYAALDRYLNGGLKRATTTVINSEHIAWNIARQYAQHHPKRLLIISLDEWRSPENTAIRLCETHPDYIDGDRETRELIRRVIDQSQVRAARATNYVDAGMQARKAAWKTPPELILIDDRSPPPPSRSVPGVDLWMAARDTNAALIWSIYGPDDMADLDGYTNQGTLGERIADTFILTTLHDEETALVSTREAPDFITIELGWDDAPPI